jgi:hypothetical protein
MNFQPDFIPIPYGVFSDPDLTPAAKLVYGRLKLYSGKVGHCCPKQETLAQEVCLKKRQLRNVLVELRDAGWISLVRARTNCVYTVYPERQLIATLETPESGNKLPVRAATDCLSGPLLYRKEKKFEKKSPLTPQGAGKEISPDELPFATPLDPQPTEVNGNGNLLRHTAERIHARHPGPRRDIGVGRVTKCLTAILKYQRIPGREQAAFLGQLDFTHAAMCASEGWQKDGGEFAKGLENWLAPTKERYLAEPPEPSKPTQSIYTEWDPPKPPKSRVM